MSESMRLPLDCMDIAPKKGPVGFRARNRGVVEDLEAAIASTQTLARPPLGVPDIPVIHWKNKKGLENVCDKTVRH